jgi:tetratricopeptide (TPR) repeat protein
MSVDLYERYKDALRRGHMAVAHGELDVALAAYQEAIALAPDRSMPHAGVGMVLLRRGSAAEALAAFDAALARSARDETSLRGRADALARLGHRTDAAEAMDILSDVQAAAGRVGDAVDSTRRALDLAEQKARRRHLGGLTRQLHASRTDEPATQPVATAARPPGLAEAAAAQEASDGDAAPREATWAPGEEAAQELAGGPAGGGAPDEIAPAETAEAAEDLVPEPVAPLDPVALLAVAEAALDAGDRPAARGAYLAAAIGLQAEGLLVAALDACYLVLAFAPDDPDVHLRLVELYLEEGWEAPAADKLALLARLTELDGGHRDARARIVGLAADHFPDDPRLHGLSARGAAPR